METKHTPGPWRFLDDEVIEDTKGHVITSLKVDRRFSLDTTMANIKLMTAAPELLKILQLILISGALNPTGKLYSIAESVIKKATE